MRREDLWPTFAMALGIVVIFMMGFAAGRDAGSNQAKPCDRPHDVRMIDCDAPHGWSRPRDGLGVVR